jgi:TRAP-type C4-dicarboxylate transport system substrate-binding protein
MISKDVFAKLPKAHQDIIMAVGAEQEKFAMDAARADDRLVADIYTKAGAKAYDIDSATLAKWQAIAKATAWKDYADRSDSTKALMAAAQKLL